MKQTHKLQVLADYQQFYLMDAVVEPQIPEHVTEKDMLRRLRTAPHIVVFHTESSSRVLVDLVIAEEPFPAEGAWEHQAEFSLLLPSGTATLCGCTDYVPDCHRIAVAPMNYSGRAYFSGVSTGGERYLVMLWPAPAQPIAPADGLRPRLS